MRTLVHTAFVRLGGRPAAVTFACSCRRLLLKVLAAAAASRARICSRSLPGCRSCATAAGDDALVATTSGPAFDEVGSAFETMKDVHVAIVVHLVLEEELAHLVKGRLREQRVRASLVLRADAFDLEVLGELIEPALEALAGLHEVLDVVEAREINLQLRKEVVLLCRQSFAGEQLHQVAEVIATVEGDPLDVIREHAARGDEELGKVDDIDAIILVAPKIDTGAR
mmetsp:Transcript_51337/g.133406  ORF Transcript_51337/g.133406 Transcript_51337/m.133406 type:complete len:226 (+) Transcript_51337:244-921(+)